MAKIFDIFKKNPPKEAKPIIEPQSKVTIINPGNFLTIDNIAPRLTQILKGKVDFNIWGFYPNLFHLKEVKLSRTFDGIRLDENPTGIVVGILCSSETHELKFFNVGPIINEIMKENT
jgi:hypothetical protein